MKNNPYVGPRPYERDDRYFYGREREERDLLSLILAEPVVLFCAASGAGKTSLLNAKIIPGLETQSFRVLDPTRVGSELPPDVDPQAVDNVFVFSALMGLAGEDVPPNDLTDQTLLPFLRQQGFSEDEHGPEMWQPDTRRLFSSSISSRSCSPPIGTLPCHLSQPTRDRGVRR